MAIQREPTGIPGFDEAVQGGLLSNSVTLISGSPGTGKSIFSQQFIHTGATQFKEKGLYISFEQRVPEIYEHAKQFGFDFEALEKKGLVRFVFMDITNRQLSSEETYIDVIKQEIRDFNPKRLVIDSITPLANIPISPEELVAYGLISEISSFMPNIPQELITRFQVHRLIMTLKDFKTTSILVSEIPKESKYLSSDRVSEFMSDAVLVFNYLQVGSSSNRSLVIEKMRGTQHSEESLNLDITKNGILIKKSEDAYKI